MNRWDLTFASAVRAAAAWALLSATGCVHASYRPTPYDASQPATAETARLAGTLRVDHCDASAVRDLWINGSLPNKFDAGPFADALSEGVLAQVRAHHFFEHGVEASDRGDYDLSMTITRFEVGHEHDLHRDLGWGYEADLDVRLTRTSDGAMLWRKTFKRQTHSDEMAPWQEGAQRLRDLLIADIVDRLVLTRDIPAVAAANARER